MGIRTRRGDFVTSFVIAALVAELLFAQCTLALLGCFLMVGRLSRWRPLWLALPGVMGISWLCVAGVKPAAAGYLAGGSHVIGLLARPDSLLAKLRNLRAAFEEWRAWLPGQLPVALIAAAAQAALLGAAGQKAGKLPYRPGPLVAARRRYLAALLRHGESATADGCCLGIIPGTGRRAVVTWQDAELGMLCTSRDAGAVSATGRDLLIGAIQHRKAVISVDLADHREPAPTGHVAWPDPVASACAQVAAPLRRIGAQAERYDPLVSALPAGATSLVMAMLDWAGVGHARQLFCASYLNAAFTLISAASAEGGAGSLQLWDELPALMEPGALRARHAGLCGRQAIGSLKGIVSELAAEVDADPSILTPVSVQLAELSASMLGQLMRPSHGVRPISLARALAGREVVLFTLDRLRHGRSAAMIARLAVADLIDHLTKYDDLGCRADCLVWVNGCEVIDQRQLAALLALGRRTGTAIALGTASGPVAARLAPEVNVTAVRGLAPAELAVPDPTSRGPDGMANALAELHGPGCDEVLSLWVRWPKPRLVAGCQVVL